MLNLCIRVRGTHGWDRRVKVPAGVGSLRFLCNFRPEIAFRLECVWASGSRESVRLIAGLGFVAQADPHRRVNVPEGVRNIWFLCTFCLEFSFYSHVFERAVAVNPFAKFVVHSASWYFTFYVERDHDSVLGESNAGTLCALRPWHWMWLPLSTHLYFELQQWLVIVCFCSTWSAKASE